jgi:hypothetical protein
MFLKSKKNTVLYRIHDGSDANPDPSLYLTSDPDPDPALYLTADPDPDPGLAIRLKAEI